MNWTPITVEKPKPNIKIMACRVGKKTNTQTFFVVYKNRTIHPWEYLDGATCYTNITHWMYIPDLPSSPD